MKTVLIALMLAMGAATTSCVPVIANLSKGSHVPKAIASYAPNETRILVLPLWADGDMSTFRKPYVIPASAIGGPESEVPRRMGFYFDFFVCGGPSKYVVGYLIVLETGSVIWTDVRGETASHDVGANKYELKLMIESGEVGPRLRDLMQYGTAKLGLRANDEERAAALSFLEAIPDASWSS